MTGRGDLVLAFAFALAAHGGVAFLGLQRLGGGGAGDEGMDRMSISTAPPAIAALVREWAKPPEVAEAEALAAPETTIESALDVRAETAVPRVAKPAAPVPNPASAPPKIVPLASTETLSAPRSDDRPVMPETVEARLSSVAPSAPLQPDTGASPNPVTSPPVEGFAPKTSVSPVGRPDRATSPAVARRAASGAGGTGLRGDKQPHALQEPARRDRQAATSVWAAEIQRRIARHHVYPRGTRDEGRVRVAMIVLPTGKLSRVSVERSSGSRSLDQAAVEAVRRAAPFPPAPDGLNEASYTVGQWITFERR